jgi:hypothetical protein
MRSGLINPDREFHVRIASSAIGPALLVAARPDDVFVVSSAKDLFENAPDVNQRMLGISSFLELRYVLNMEATYE